MAQIYLSGVGGVGGWLYSDYNASLSSNWTELDWTGTELGKMLNLTPVSQKQSKFKSNVKRNKEFQQNNFGCSISVNFWAIKFPKFF